MAERKRFINVEIPILETTIQVLGTLENLDKKTIKLDLTRQLRGKGLEIVLRIFNHDGKLIAVPKKLELMKAYIRRMMRKRADYVEDSFVAQCADLKTTIKPFLITRKRVSRAVRKNLRNTAKEFILDYVKDKTYNELADEVLEGTFQKTMLPKLKKVYPLSFCEFRIFETKDLEKIDLSTIKVKEVEAPAEEAVEEVKEETAKEEAEVEESKEEVEKEKPAKKEKKTTKKVKEAEEVAPEKKKATKKTAKKE
jgi:ribosomal protein S3AE